MKTEAALIASVASEQGLKVSPALAQAHIAGSPF
jgi:hypothetical protein